MLPKEGKMNLPPLHIGHKQAPEAKQFAIQSRLFKIYISFLNNLILNVYEAWPNSVETIGQIHRIEGKLLKKSISRYFYFKLQKYISSFEAPVKPYLPTYVL